MPLGKIIGLDPMGPVGGAALEPIGPGGGGAPVAPGPGSGTGPAAGVVGAPVLERFYAGQVPAVAAGSSTAPMSWLTAPSVFGLPRWAVLGGAGLLGFWLAGRR